MNPEIYRAKRDAIEDFMQRLNLAIAKWPNPVQRILLRVYLHRAYVKTLEEIEK